MMKYDGLHVLRVRNMNGDPRFCKAGSIFRYAHYSFQGDKFAIRRASNAGDTRIYGQLDNFCFGWRSTFARTER